MIDINKYYSLLEQPLEKMYGKVTKFIGLTIESLGPSANINDLCIIYSNNNSNKGTYAEVVGFRDNRILLMPYGDVEGVGIGSLVKSTGAPFHVDVGYGMLGMAVDGLGRPIDVTKTFDKEDSYSVEATPPDPLSRKMIEDILPLGVKAVDTLLTIGKGQRVGIFAGSGVGKSTLMGMFARNTKADINVIALIGERGREVREFIERDLGEEGMKRSVVVVATSDQPALIRKKAAKTATAIAEFFRDKGEDVLLMMDSLTRFSMAQREIGLASGEPPVTRGYPPSVYSEMPKLLERAGNASRGSITGLYTVLVDGDDMNEPIADTARGILDVLQSISRCMSAIVTAEHKKLAGNMKNVLATYRSAEDLINIGAYKPGSNPDIDFAISKIKEVNAFLMQKTDEKFLLGDELEELRSIFAETE